MEGMVSLEDNVWPPPAEGVMMGVLLLFENIVALIMRPRPGRGVEFNLSMK